MDVKCLAQNGQEIKRSTLQYSLSSSDNLFCVSIGVPCIIVNVVVQLQESYCDSILTPRTQTRQTPLVFHYLLEFAHLIFCCPFFFALVSQHQDLFQ